MTQKDDEREFRLRPGKAKASKGNSDAIAWSAAFKIITHYPRQTRSAGHQGSSGSASRRPHRQRCAVRITYSKNATRGQWRAHGRYLERESALSGTLGFDSKDSGVPISSRLESWQSQNDELLWKFIISPEFGDRADLKRLTRDLMGGVEEDFGRPLEWVAAIHQNTEYPHVHVALRGVSADGNVLRLSRDYIKSGIREIAEDLCTRQLGYRTTLDASEAECREITQARYTSLDRFIFRHARASDTDLVFNPTSVNNIERNQRISARLVTLSRMGLAERTGDGSWSLRHDTEQVLRSMQRAKDRQKTLSVHGALLSDDRLPIEAINWRQLESVEGRVLVHWRWKRPATAED